MCVAYSSRSASAAYLSRSLMAPAVVFDTNILFSAIRLERPPRRLP